jgi:hypothetical protein
MSTKRRQIKKMLQSIFDDHNWAHGDVNCDDIACYNCPIGKFELQDIDGDYSTLCTWYTGPWVNKIHLLEDTLKNYHIDAHAEITMSRIKAELNG